MKDKISKKILGLDLGTSSIGWSIIEKDNDEKVCLLDGGVRIFQEPRDPKTKETLNTVRRAKRGARRIIKRRNERIEQLKKHLILYGLFPKTSDEQAKYYALNPYELRAKGLDTKLEEYELGRTLLHIGQRRGFQSNRKSPLKSEEKGLLKEISDLEKIIESSPYRTLGEYLYHIQSKEPIRSRYTRRDMYFKEFSLIIEKQKEFYSQLSITNIQQIQRDIFFQNPLRIQKNLIGECTFFSNRQRAHNSSLWSQEFRIWQDINNLRYYDTYGDSCALNKNQRISLFESLQKSKELSFSRIKKILSFPEELRMNFEKSKKVLKGNSTNSQILLIVGEYWNTLERDKKDAFVRYLIDIASPQTLATTLKNKFGDFLTSEMIQKLCELDFSSSSYMNLSEKALKKIVPILSIESQIKTTKEGEILEELPITYGEVVKKLGLVERVKYDFSKDKEVQLDYKNPSVTKAMIEVKKIVKALKKKYGTPDEIHIELGSEMKLSEEKRKLIEKKQKENEEKNKNARNKIQEIFTSIGIKGEPSREDILKYKLFIFECQEKGSSLCPYTGKTISLKQLFSGEIDVEHIIPWSRSLDDSYLNKTLCYADFNRKIKGNKTPYEIFSGNPEEYERVKQRIKNYPFKKRARFEQKEIDMNEFFAQQLIDTQYISQEVKNFLFAYFQEKSKIFITKGQLTSVLRYSWGWNRFLWGEGFDEEIKKTKNRGDHRHHFIDAIIVALTSQSILQKASILSSQNKILKKEEIFGNLKPEQTFEKSIQEKLEKIIISFAAKHKVNGAFHKETGYGLLSDDTVRKLGLGEIKEGIGYFVKRVSLDENFKIDLINYIYDKSIRELLSKYMKKDDEFNQGEVEIWKTPREAFSKIGEWKLFHNDGKTPIKSIRIYEKKSLSSIYDYKNEGSLFYETGSNHHVEILEHIRKTNKDGTPLRTGIFVTMLEAGKRAIQKKPLVQTSGPWKYGDEMLHEDDWKFVMSLMINDMVDIQGKIFRVQKMSGANNKITFIPQYDSGDDKNAFGKSPNTFIGKKIQISPIGVKYIAND